MFMACSEWQLKIDSYVDSELPPEEAARFGEHLRSCADCAASALSRMKVKKAVQFGARAHHPSSEFRSKIREQIAERKASRGSWLMGALATATLALVILVSVQGAFSRAESRQIVSEIADLHVSNLASGSPVDVVSTDRHTVKPWFQGRVPFTFDLPELAGSEFTLVGGRMVFVQREPAALLIFKYHSHFLSVFVLSNKPPVSNLGSLARQQAAFNVQSWEQVGLRYILITDAESVEASRLATLLRTTSSK
jgi:anti-sigma factor RsiW